MSRTHYSDIASALDGHLDGMNHNVAWENRHFKPPTDGSLYLRQYNMPVSTRIADLGSDANDYTVGIYQVDVVGIAGKGKAAIYELADKVADHFRTGVRVQYNGISVRITQVERAAITIDERSAFMPITVYYESYTRSRNPNLVIIA